MYCKRFDFFMNSDSAMIKINMKEFRFVYLQKTHEIILLTALRVLFANYHCFLLFIKAMRIFKSKLNVNEKVVIRPSTVLFFLHLNFLGHSLGQFFS